MTIPGASVAQVTRREALPPMDFLLLGALAYFILLGGTDIGTISVLRGINALIGAAFIGYWLVYLPQRADAVDRFLLAALVLYLLACALAAFPRASLDAAMDALTYAAVFGISRWRAGSATTARAAVTLLGICGVALTVLMFSLWGQVWIAWYQATGSFPPLDAPLPVGPYRHPHVVAMLVALLAPALLQILQRRAGRLIGAAGLILSAVVLLMAGGRGVWLAVILVIACPILFRLLRTKRSVIALAGAMAIATAGAIATGVASPILARILTTSTVTYRLAYWQEAVDLWMQKPLAGWGPGTYSVTATLGDFFSTNTYLPRHADNPLIQGLAEGGLLEISAMALVAVAIYVGIRQQRGVSTVWSIAAISLFVLMSLTDNPSDSPNLVMIVIVWAAISAPSLRQSHSHRLSTPIKSNLATRGATALLSLVLLVAISCTTLASFAFAEARRAASVGAWDSARSDLVRAVRLDPGMALYARILGSYYHADGDDTQAESLLRRAVRLNPADATAYRALALVQAANSDKEGAISTAQAAVTIRHAHTINLLTLSFVASHAGAADIGYAALTESLVYAPWLPASRFWDYSVGSSQRLPKMIRAASRLSDERVSDSPGWDFSRMWLKTLAGTAPEAYEAPLSAIDAALRCNLAQARATLDAMSQAEQHSHLGVIARLLIARMSDDQSMWNEGVTLAGLRQLELGELEPRRSKPDSPFVDYGEDIRLYGRIPVAIPASGPLLPNASEALVDWIMTPPNAEVLGTSANLHPCTEMATARSGA